MNKVKQVAAAVMFSDGKVLIARRKAGEKMAGCWEFPGGKVENGETAQACLERELKEELGLTVAAGPVLARVSYKYDHGAIELLAMPAEILSGDLILTVHDQVCWVKPTGLGRYALAPADVLIAEQFEIFETPNEKC